MRFTLCDFCSAVWLSLWHFCALFTEDRFTAQCWHMASALSSINPDPTCDLWPHTWPLTPVAAHKLIFLFDWKINFLKSTIIKFSSLAVLNVLVYTCVWKWDCSGTNTRMLHFSSVTSQLYPAQIKHSYKKLIFELSTYNFFDVLTRGGRFRTSSHVTSFHFLLIYVL